MLLNKDIDESGFNQLLNWLSNNRDESAQKYSEIHYKLILYFAARSCAEAEDLADQTINRVIKKVSKEDFDYEGNKIKYFYGFAKNVHYEYLRSRNIQLNEEMLEADTLGLDEIDNKEITRALSLLKVCLKKLEPKDRRLIMKYYDVDSGREIDFRRKIAKKYGLTVNLLRVKVFRLKKTLTNCVENSLKS